MLWREALKIVKNVTSGEQSGQEGLLLYVYLNLLLKILSFIR